MRTYTASGRSRWPFIIGGAALVLVIALALLYGLDLRAPSAAKPATVLPSSNSADQSAATADPTAPSSDGEVSAPPTGCLGGPGRDVNMVLAAQKNAPHTAFGAVEVATAFMRWGVQYPLPTSDEVAAASAIFPSDKAAASTRSLNADYAANPNPSHGNAPNGATFYMSTVSGLWYVDPASSVDRVVVDVNANYVIAGVLSPTKSLAEAFVMTWSDNAWRVDSLQTANTSKLGAGGTAFTGGC